MLDEACMSVGKVTDEVFLQGLNGKLAKHAHYTSRKVGVTLCVSQLFALLYKWKLCILGPNKKIQRGGIFIFQPNTNLDI